MLLDLYIILIINVVCREYYFGVRAKEIEFEQPEEQKEEVKTAAEFDEELKEEVQ